MELAAEHVHPSAERADAGQNDAARAEDLRRIAADHRGHSRASDRLLDAAQVAHAVIDDRDHRIPLVESTPRTRGSIDAAWDSARASPLNDASTMWWGLRPEIMLTCRFMPTWLVSASRKSCTSSTSKVPTRSCPSLTL